jgi:hypothetical protein
VAREEFSAGCESGRKRFRENLHSNPRVTCEAVAVTDKSNADFIRHQRENRGAYDVGRRRDRSTVDLLPTASQRASAATIAAPGH